MQLSRSLVALAWACALAACNDSDPLDPEQRVARLRIVNAAPNTDDVEVLRSGSTAPLTTLDYRGTTSTCVEVPPGNQTLTFRSGGTTLATGDVTLEANTDYSLFLSTADGNRVVTLLTDEQTAPAEMNYLRFFNATTASGDVWVGPPADGLGNKVAGNLAVVGKTDVLPPYTGVSESFTRVRFFANGVTTGTPRAELAVTTLPGRGLGTVVFTDAPGPTAMLVLPCS